MTDKIECSVLDYFESVFCEFESEIIRSDLKDIERLKEFKELPVVSVCGLHCVRIIEKGHELISICDKTAAPLLLAGIIDAMMTVYIG